MEVILILFIIFALKIMTLITEECIVVKFICSVVDDEIKFDLPRVTWRKFK